MQTWQHKFIRWQQITLIAALTIIMLFIMLFALNQSTSALRIASGAGGCGDFDDAVFKTPEGDTIVQMITAKPSNGVTIDKDLAVQGGWDAGTGCNDANEQSTNNQQLIISGFMLLAPEKRSLLTHAGIESVITIDPKVEAVLLQHMMFQHTSGSDTNGGGISGTLNIKDATVRLDNVIISDSESLQDGGGLYMSLQNGSRLEILNSRIMNNQADNGGGFEIEVHGNSHLLIQNSEVTTNTAVSGNGGGGHIIISSGFVTISNSIFNGNSTSGSGNGLSIVKTGSAPATVTLINTSTDGPIHQTGSNLTLKILDEQIFLPLVIQSADSAALHAEITGITVNTNNKYEVSFNTVNFTPNTSSNHVHFFFNTVPPMQAGSPGSGPWKLYGGASPFTNYETEEKPILATHMCVLVANSAHQVTQGSGNCYPLPE